MIIYQLFRPPCSASTANWIPSAAGIRSRRGLSHYQTLPVLFAVSSAEIRGRRGHSPRWGCGSPPSPAARRTGGFAGHRCCRRGRSRRPWTFWELGETKPSVSDEGGSSHGLAEPPSLNHRSAKRSEQDKPVQVSQQQRGDTHSLRKCFS